MWRCEDLLFISFLYSKGWWCLCSSHLDFDRMLLCLAPPMWAHNRPRVDQDVLGKQTTWSFLDIWQNAPPVTAPHVSQVVTSRLTLWRLWSPSVMWKTSDFHTVKGIKGARHSSVTKSCCAAQHLPCKALDVLNCRSWRVVAGSLAVFAAIRVMEVSSVSISLLY